MRVEMESAQMLMEGADRGEGHDGLTRGVECGRVVEALLVFCGEW